jgi:hypothetical protein
LHTTTCNAQKGYLSRPFCALPSSHLLESNRLRGQYGAARAAELAGELEKARSFYEELLVLSANADSERAEVAEAKAFLAQ